MRRRKRRTSEQQKLSHKNKASTADFRLCIETNKKSKEKKKQSLNRMRLAKCAKNQSKFANEKSCELLLDLKFALMLIWVHHILRAIRQQTHSSFHLARANMNYSIEIEIYAC